VISVIVYGRNDAHGYNLHKRAALSLNCVAEVLTDSDDEIVFVDYNTPDELPTFVEALADTLTDRCLGLLRVIRVPSAIHEDRFAGRTHLPVVEPVARNVGVRRANPSNRWLLSTNTDMIFVPHSGESLSDVCTVLSDGFYGLPRYELPEWLWEKLPRTDPRHAISDVAKLGPGLRLDEATLSIEAIRFDAPGDFQLVLREDFVAIDGFDEEMVLGFHVDSNLSKRILLHRGSIGSLDEAVSGYHCNHNRERTVYHGTGTVTNDADRFVFAIERPNLPAQRATWGLVDAALEEVSAGRQLGGSLADALLAAIPPSAGPRVPSEAARVPFEATYDSGHILPFVADALAVSASDAAIGYLGANPVLEEMLGNIVTRLGFTNPLQVANLDDLGSVDELIRTADVFIVDLGIDASLVDVSPPRFRIPVPPPLPPSLARAFSALERLVELERSRLARGNHPRRVMLVHSWTVFWNPYVEANLDCSYTTPHSRVRRATVKPVPSDDEETREAISHSRRLVRWAARDLSNRGRLQLRSGETVELADLRDYRAFGVGWSYPDDGGIWTQGQRSEVAVGLDGVQPNDDVLVLTLGGACVGRDAPLEVDLLVDGEPVASRIFRNDHPPSSWHVELPRTAVAHGTLDLSLSIADPRSPVAVGWSSEDDRPLGILVGSLGLVSLKDEETRLALTHERRLQRWAARDATPGRLHLRSGEALEVAGLENYGGFGDGWSHPDEGGIWTVGPRAELAAELEAGGGDGDHVLSLSLGGVCAEPGATLAVSLLLDGERVSSRRFSERDPVTWQVDLPSRALTESAGEIALVIDDPRSPLALGWSRDERPLGVHIHAITLREVDRTLRLGETVGFAAGSGGDRLLGDGWWELDSAGVWTVGAVAFLVVELIEDSSADADLFLDLTAFVPPAHPELDVEVLARQRRLTRAAFRHGKEHRRLRIPFPTNARSGTGPTVLEFRIDEPARPAELGVGDDMRLLGLYLYSLTARRSGFRRRLMYAAAYRTAKLRKRLT
jgi:hypothetical protein